MGDPSLCPMCRRPYGQHSTRESKHCRARARGDSVAMVLATRTTPVVPMPGARPAAEIERPRGAPAPFGKLVGVPPPSPLARPSNTSADATARGLDPAAVRDWAIGQGYVVGQRGRIKAEIIEAYQRWRVG